MSETQFYYLIVGFKGVFIARTCFPDVINFLISGPVGSSARRPRRETDHFKNNQGETNSGGHIQTPVICPCGPAVNNKSLVNHDFICKHGMVCIDTDVKIIFR